MADPRGILEAGGHVQELHAPSGRGLRAMTLAEMVEVEAVGTEAHADHPRLRGPEGGGGADVRGPLDEDHVAGIDEHARDEIEALLAAFRDEHLVRRRHHSLRRGVIPHRDQERGEAAREDVLERSRAFAREDVLEDRAEAVHRKRVRAGLAGCEGDDPRLLDERAHAPNGGEAHAARRAREALLPVRGHLFRHPRALLPSAARPLGRRSIFRPPPGTGPSPP